MCVVISRTLALFPPYSVICLNCAHCDYSLICHTKHFVNRHTLISFAIYTQIYPTLHIMTRLILISFPPHSLGR